MLKYNLLKKSPLYMIHPRYSMRNNCLSCFSHRLRFQENLFQGVQEKYFIHAIPKEFSKMPCHLILPFLLFIHKNALNTIYCINGKMHTPQDFWLHTQIV